MAETMKDSGQEWIGTIPESWDTNRIRYCLDEINVKNSPVKTEQILSLVKDKGVMLYEEKGDVGNKAKEDITGYKVAFPNTLIVNSMNILIGSVGISQYKGCVSPVYYVFREKDNSDLRFINYIFNTREFQKELRKYANGILEIRLRVSATDIFNRKMPLPSKDEQIKIADFLDKKCVEIDQLSEDIQKQIDILEEYKKRTIKNVFDEYMGDYTFKRAKLGDLSVFATKQTGFDYSKTISPSLVGEKTDNTIPYLQTRHFKDNFFNFNTQYYIPKHIAKFFPRIILNKKCLLFSIVGASIGNVAVFPGTETAFLGGAICKVLLRDNSLYDYIKHFMMSIYGQDQITLRINSSAQGTITIEDVRHFKIPVFDNKDIMIEISDKINKFCETHYKTIAEKQEQLEMLADYKKSIIYEYVTGKKRVA